MNEPDVRQPPASPVSCTEDDLLTGSEVIGVEREMAKLNVSSLDWDGGASI